MPETDAPNIAEKMGEAALDFLNSLSSQQRGKAIVSFDDVVERKNWHYTPIARQGLPLDEMNGEQRRLAHRLTGTGLSLSASVAVSTIVGLENTLDAVEGWRPGAYPGQDGPSRWRDPAMYFLTVFGEPNSKDLWGWRFEGHHISLNYTIAKNQIISPTPSFFGANPAESPLPGGRVLRPLAGEEDLARELLHSLDQAQQKSAIISSAAPPDLVQSNRSQVEDGVLPLPTPALLGWEIDEVWQERLQAERDYLGYDEVAEEAVRYSEVPKGISASEFNQGQLDLLEAVVSQYINRLPEELASEEFARLTDEVVNEVYFAWAGGSERYDPHYYRLQAPRFLVEYDCTQGQANHIHSVWRDPRGDFGSDLLAAHYAESHSDS